MLATRLKGVWPRLRISNRTSRLTNQFTENVRNDAFDLTAVHVLTSPATSAFHKVVEIRRS